MRQFGDGRNVDEVEHRVGRRFEEDDLRRRRKRAAPLVEIRPVDEFGRHAPARQDVVEDGVAGTEQRAAGNHPVAAVELAGQRGEDTGHAGAGGKAGLGALKRGKTVLEHRHGRVAVARIDETVGLAGKGGGGLFGAVIDIAGGHVERLARLLEGGAVKPAPDKLRVAPVTVSHRPAPRWHGGCREARPPGRNTACRR